MTVTGNCNPGSGAIQKAVGSLRKRMVYLYAWQQPENQLINESNPKILREVTFIPTPTKRSGSIEGRIPIDLSGNLK
jgi:hypothetical protein